MASRREKEAEAKRQRLEEFLESHKGLSKYQLKKLERKGIDISKIGGTP